MRTFLIAAALVALPVLAACGNDKAADQPAVTQADLAKSLQDKGLKDKNLADCAAKLYVDQGISQEGLRKMVSDEYDAKAADANNFGMSQSDADKAREANTKIFTECRSK
ncbi:hypothetical protein ACQPXH_31710 [Nocardia sp. CA-135953]|uniref:hypothetical protein n=1 Tax=unclassified Nocardia TaxID=2637762 RepID=UPI003D963752